MQVDTLLRLCYVDNREFNDLTFTDTDQCRRQVQQGFNRGFKLRRKGHPGGLSTTVIPCTSLIGAARSLT